MNTLVVAAIIPAVVLMWYIWKKDKVEKEPAKAIMKVAIAGGISVISAMILEFAGDFIVKDIFEVDETTIL